MTHDPHEEPRVSPSPRHSPQEEDPPGTARKGVGWVVVLVAAVSFAAIIAFLAVMLGTGVD